MGKLRYLVPSAITTIGMAFAALSLEATLAGHYRTAAWWCAWCLLTDKLDGAAARGLRARSELGAQLDSLADFFAFGVAPATLYYAFYSRTPGAGWDDRLHRGVLLGLTFFYIVCVAARLARFNATHGGSGGGRYFVGWSSPYVNGMLMSLLLVAMKYGDPAWTAADPSTDHLRPFGALSLAEPARYLPWLLIPYGLAMVSNLRLPNVSRDRTIGNLLVVLALVVGVGVGLARRLPEYLAIGGAAYMLLALRFHFLGQEGRGVPTAPWFPDDPPPAG